VLEALAAGGIDYADVNRTLEDEGLAKFEKAFTQLLRAIGRKRASSR
jgi:transaldolase